MDLELFTRIRFEPRVDDAFTWGPRNGYLRVTNVTETHVEYDTRIANVESHLTTTREIWKTVIMPKFSAFPIEYVEQNNG